MILQMEDYVFYNYFLIKVQKSFQGKIIYEIHLQIEIHSMNAEYVIMFYSFSSSLNLQYKCFSFCFNGDVLFKNLSTQRACNFMYIQDLYIIGLLHTVMVDLGCSVSWICSSQRLSRFSHVYTSFSKKKCFNVMPENRLQCYVCLQTRIRIFVGVRLAKQCFFILKF